VRVIEEGFVSRAFLQGARFNRELSSSPLTPALSRRERG